MAREQQPATYIRVLTDIRIGHMGLERLRESMERLLGNSEVHYGVRFDDNCADSNFAYSWDAIWSEN